jgi:CRP-like cAMP-binding protein
MSAIRLSPHAMALDALQALEALRACNFPQLAPPPRSLLPSLQGQLAIKRLAAGRLLFAQGAPTSALYAVLSGEIAIRLRAADGSESLLEHVQATRLFGLSAFATGLPSRYEAVASCSTQLLVIGQPAYALLMDRWPGFARALLQELARRYDGTLHLLESARHRSATERLELALAQLRRERGEAQAGGGWQLRATQAELAQLAGVTRQTANQWLQSSGVRRGYRLLRKAGAMDAD